MLKGKYPRRAGPDNTNSTSHMRLTPMPPFAAREYNGAPPRLFQHRRSFNWRDI